ncbi:hypothetical protein [Jiella marina]|uniref:hypothetical protein n=1 Tax=Jiella sp. LLJ827 TaxID=2917712 RepID=UPI002100EA6E|nr:hypothetical protein [Jiella sp. LLJ827]MCQ0988026.1 hypothetical protein [Jiella sp. LLJ827]
MALSGEFEFAANEAADLLHGGKPTIELDDAVFGECWHRRASSSEAPGTRIVVDAVSMSGGLRPYLEKHQTITHSHSSGREP